MNKSQLFSIGSAITTMGFAHASIINTPTAATVSVFQAGAAVELFDDLPALSITSYSPVAVPGANQFHSRNLANPGLPEFNSGGATFNNPASNPGVPVGVFDPSGGIAANFNSPNNVLGPIELDGANNDLAFGNGFMEVIFQVPVSKVGFWVTSGAVTMILKDTSNINLAAGDVTVVGTAGNFIGIERPGADIGGITLLASAAAASFTLDDFTSSLTTVPEVSGSWPLLGLGAVFWLSRRTGKNSRR